MSVLWPEAARRDLLHHRGSGRDRASASRVSENANVAEDLQLRRVGRRDDRQRSRGSTQVSQRRSQMGRRQFLLSGRRDLGFEETRQRGDRVPMGFAHVQHRSGPGEEDQMQLPQSDTGGEEAARRPTWRSQEAP